MGILHFADGTTLTLEGTHYEKLICDQNTELKKVVIWLNANKLSLDLKKNHFMVFHRATARLKGSGLNVYVNDSPIELLLIPN